VAERFGKYELLRKLAEGGMAELFLARQIGDQGFEKLVVIKRILPVLSPDPAIVSMLVDEGRVLAKMSHPNIVQVFDMNEIDDQYYIAMEYVHGEDLRKVGKAALAAGQVMPLPLACRIVADTLAGLHYAHTRTGEGGKSLGIVHRDVSPQNIIVTYEGGVKLVDFGIMRMVGNRQTEQTQAGTLKGKFAYMSPEQARGVPVDARSDVFTAGIVLWELATGKRLFKRQTEMMTLVAVAEEEIFTPSEIEPNIPKALSDIVMKALDRNINKRYQTAQAMRVDLDNLIRERKWAGDALGLEEYMRMLYAEKLHEQERDVRAAGHATLEQFLLNVDEKSSVHWIGPATTTVPKVTPKPDPNLERSVDSVATQALRPQSAAATLSQRKPLTPPGGKGRSAKVPSTPSAGTKMPPSTPRKQTGRAAIVDPPTMPDLQRFDAVTSLDETIPTSRKRSVTDSVADILDEDAPTPQLLPTMRSATAAARRAEEVAAKIHIQPTAPISLNPEASSPFSSSHDTPAITPSARAHAAALVAQLNDEDQPQRFTWDRMLVVIFIAIGVSGLAIAAIFLTSSTPEKSAYLDISVQSPASIDVDGKSQDVTKATTLHVSPELEHMIVVRRPGSSPRQITVPRLMPGQHFPLSF
jgi:serine/threonine protein kinase